MYQFLANYRHVLNFETYKFLILFFKSITIKKVLFLKSTILIRQSQIHISILILNNISFGIIRNYRLIFGELTMWP